MRNWFERVRLTVFPSLPKYQPPVCPAVAVAPVLWIVAARIDLPIFRILAALMWRTLLPNQLAAFWSALGFQIALQCAVIGKSEIAPGASGAPGSPGAGPRLLWTFLDALATFFSKAARPRFMGPPVPGYSPRKFWANAVCIGVQERDGKAWHA